jgi:hypothetical protein
MLKLVTALSLARSARKRSDVVSGVGRALVGMAAPWVMPTLLLHAGERDVEADPGSLGTLFEDTDYMWWWVRTKANLPVYTCAYVSTREEARDAETGLVLVTGDETFDARFVTTRHPTMPECHECATAIVTSPTVRSILSELLVHSTDRCTIGSHITLTRHRSTGSFDDVILQMERVASLAAAQEAAFAAAPYR